MLIYGKEIRELMKEQIRQSVRNTPMKRIRQTGIMNFRTGRNYG